MAALPTTTAAFASGATEAQFKTFLTGQRDYLVGLFGADGTAATAKSTLGVVAGVSSVNGNAGAISAAQISDAATAGYGYTPSSSSHIHNASTQEVGCYVFAACVYSGTAGLSLGAQKAGSLLSPASCGILSGEFTGGLQGDVLTGTWQLAGGVRAGPSWSGVFGLWQRIA